MTMQRTPEYLANLAREMFKNNMRFPEVFEKLGFHQSGYSKWECGANFYFKDAVVIIEYQFVEIYYKQVTV